MKSKYFLSSALSLAIVGASVVSPFSYAYLFEDEVNKYEQIYASYETLIDYQKSIYDTITGNACSLTLHRTQYGVKYTYYFTGKYQFDYYGRNSYGDYVSFYIDGGYLYDDRSYPGKNYFEMNFDGNQATSILWGGDRYYFDEQTGWNNNEVDFLSLPEDSSISSRLTNWKLKTPNLVSNPNSPNSVLTQNIIKSIEPIKPPAPTEPPNTTPAPGFPNLPDNWVNGGGDVDIKIDLPDIDFNLPDLPDYTLPDAPTVPEKFMTATNTIVGKCWDIIVQSGLTWLAIFSLTIALISYIFSR